jgi:8-oxo-dGTP diphosphatase
MILAGALLTDESGRFLLMRRSTPGTNWWEVPGGKIEPGESPWTAARRELLEELRVTIEFVDLIASERFVWEGQNLQYTWFVARVAKGTPGITERDRFDQIRYFTWDEIRSLHNPSPSLKCLRGLQVAPPALNAKLPMATPAI